MTVAYNLGTPAISKVSPTHGVTAGGKTVKVTGTGLLEAGSVLFGSTPATSFTVLSSTSISAVAPAGTAGTVDVRVTSPLGTSPVTTADHFLYKG